MTENPTQHELLARALDEKAYSRELPILRRAEFTKTCRFLTAAYKLGLLWLEEQLPLLHSQRFRCVMAGVKAFAAG